MNKRHPYNNIIERKLEQLPIADPDLLWRDMHLILDEEMPQKKERRRFIGWLLPGKAILLPAVIFLAITGSFFFLLPAKKSSTIATSQLPDSPQPDKFNEDKAAKTVGERKDDILTAVKPDQKNSDDIIAAIPPGGAVDYIANNSLITQQPITPAKKYATKDQFTKSIQAISKTNLNSDIVPVKWKAVQKDFQIATNHNREIDSLIREKDLTTNVAKKGIRNIDKGRFYTGVITGVDLSAIRFRSVKTGSTKGLIIGYAFTKKWSIESGLFWETKRVFDDGSYFNPPGYAPSNGITITAVNSKNRLYEWPVNMKYTIISGKHSLFATTGLSSYFMRSENYDYEYMQNNQPGGHNYLTYKNETKNWIGVVNLSTGYIQKFGDLGSLRVEPYLKLPIKNLGTGKMPIMSAGLNVGFIKAIR